MYIYRLTFFSLTPKERIYTPKSSNIRKRSFLKFHLIFQFQWNSGAWDTKVSQNNMKSIMFQGWVIRFPYCSLNLQWCVQVSHPQDGEDIVITFKNTHYYSIRQTFHVTLLKWSKITERIGLFWMPLTASQDQEHMPRKGFCQIQWQHGACLLQTLKTTSKYLEWHRRERKAKINWTCNEH